MEKTYKLELGLNYSTQVPETPALCVLCHYYVTDSHYRLTVEAPHNVMIYDEECWEQLLAIGLKMYQQQIADQTERKN